MFVEIGSAAGAFGPRASGQKVLRDRIEDNIGRLSTGLRIRNAGDGPAALVASDFLRARVRSLEQANENLQSGSNFLAVAEGALQEVSSLLVRLRELAIRSANFVEPTVDENLQKEADAIVEAIDRIGETTRSARTQLFSGDFQRTVVVSPLSSTGNVGAVGATVPDFSTLSLGFHELLVRGAGGMVTAVDTSAGTVGVGEEGQVTDGGAAAPLMTNSMVVFNTGGDNWWVQDLTGLDATIVNLNPNARTAITDVKIGPDNNSIVFEADNPLIPGNRSIFRVSFAGVETQLASGTDDSDYDVSLFTDPTPGVTYVAPPSPWSILPSIDDVDAMAYDPTTNTVLVVDNNGGAPLVQRYTTAGSPVAGTFALPGATEILGMDYFGANNFYVLDRDGGGTYRVRQYNIVGAVAVENLGAQFVLPGVTFGATNVTTFMGTAGANDSISEAAVPLQVDNAALVRFRETITLTFTEDATTNQSNPIAITGSISGVIPFGGEYNFAGGMIAIPALGISVDINTLRGASRGGAGAVSSLLGLVNRMGVSVDGGVFHPDNFNGPFPTGPAIAAGIEFQVNSTAPAGPTIQAVFDPAGGPATQRYILQSDTLGGLSSVTTAPGVPAPQDRQDDLRFRVVDGAVTGVGADLITGDNYSFVIATTGSNYRGITWDGANLRVGDIDTGMVYSFNAAGAQQPEQIDFTSLGFGSIERLEFDPTASGGLGSLFVLSNAGQVVEIDDQPLVPGGVVPVFRNNFVQSGTELGITADNGGSLFLGNDLGQQVRQVANTGAGLGAVVNYQDLGTMLVNQIGVGFDPHMSKDSNVIAYLRAGTIETANTVGATLFTRAVAGVLSIDDVSVNGQYVAYQTGAGGFVIDMTTGAITPTGSNQEFHPGVNNFVFYESGGNIFRRTLGGGVIQLTGVGAIPAGSGDFDVSPNGVLLTFRDPGGDLWVINSDGSSAVATDITIPPTPSPTGGNTVSFSPNSTLVTFQGDDGDVWVRNATGVNIPVLAGGSAWDVAPSVNVVNTVVRETFTLTVTGDVDGADVFSVTGSVSGAHAAATAGVAYTSDPGGGGLGAGLQFTIRESGQYAVGTTFTIDTDFVFGASLDGGPEVIAAAGRSEILFSPDDEALEVEFGTIRPAVPMSQAILVEPGGVLQSNTEILRTDQLPFHIDALSSRSLELVPFNLEDFAPAIAGTELRSAGLVVLSGPAIVDPNQPVVAETIKVEFTSPAVFQVTGSVSGVFLQDQAFVPGTPITAGNITFTLGGAAAVGDEYLIEVQSNTALVDQAIDKISRLRAELGSKIGEIEGLGRANSANLLELMKTISTIVDLDFGAEVADLTRNQVLTQAMIGLNAQVTSARETILSLLQGNLKGIDVPQALEALIEE